MKKAYIALIFLALSVSGFSQQENYNMEWVQGFPITFKTTFTGAGPVNQFWDTMSAQYFSGGHSNICNAAGNLLLATDGGDIYDGNRQKIDNGDTILSRYAYISLGSLGMQNTIILPLGDSIYYVFNVAWSDSAAYKYFVLGQSAAIDQLLYHVVDMKQNNYAGKVIKKKQVAIDSARLCSSHMTAVRHGNGEDWWVVKQGLVTGTGANKTYTVLVRKDTVLGPYVQTYPNTANGIVVGNWTGQSAFNNAGTKYAFIENRRYLFMADFDRCTGLFTNPMRLTVPIDYPDDTTPTGLCFSPNDSFLYINHFRSIFQWEINNPDSATAWAQGEADRWHKCFPAWPPAFTLVFPGCAKS